MLRPADSSSFMARYALAWEGGVGVGVGFVGESADRLGLGRKGKEAKGKVDAKVGT